MPYYDSEFNFDMKKRLNCPNRPCGSGVVANNRLVDYRLIDFFGHSSAPFSPIGLIFSPINSLGMIYPKTKFLFVVDLRAAFMFRKLTIFYVQKKKILPGMSRDALCVPNRNFLADLQHAPLVGKV